MRNDANPDIVADGRVGTKDGLMTRTRWAIVGVALGLIPAAWVSLDQAPRGSAQGVGGAVRMIARGVQDASSSARAQFVQARASARNLGIEQQIRARLVGDKTLD